MFGITDTALYLAWVYTEKGGSVGTAHIEGTDGTDYNEVEANGTVRDDGGTTATAVTLPALSLARPAGYNTYRVEGPNIAIGTDVDFVRYPTDESVPFAGQDFSVVVFETINCSSYPGGSWQELQALMWPRDGNRLLVGIFYLYPGRSEVGLQDQIALPSLVQPSGKRFDAKWSRT